MDILRLGHVFYFIIICFFIIIHFCCNNPVSNDQSSFIFSLFDVGQGLSQIAVKDSHAIVWDLGPPEAYASWKKQYKNVGKPLIDAVVISHRDIDHSGGLLFLDTSINWTGTLVMSSYEDSAYLKQLCGNWKKGITCKIIGEGERLDYLEGVDIQCIWPFDFQEEYPCSELLTNYYSLVFLLKYNLSQIIITSDIDSAAGQMISVKYGTTLMSDIMIVPHHGSAYSVNSTFFGYIRPKTAIISCSKNNPYEHPSDAALRLLMQLGAEILITYIDNSVYFRSNGYYWECFR